MEMEKQVAMIAVSFQSVAQYIEWSIDTPVSRCAEKSHSSWSDALSASGKRESCRVNRSTYSQKRSSLIGVIVGWCFIVIA